MQTFNAPFTPRPERPPLGVGPRAALLLAALLTCAEAVRASGATAGALSPDRLLATGQGQGRGGLYGLAADGHRDDGDLARGRPHVYTFAHVASPTMAAENLVVDENTGLMWVRSLGSLDGNDGKGVHANKRLDRPMAWQEAIDAANELRYGGFDDWRLPNVNELQTLVEFDHYASVLDPAAFPEPFGKLPSSYFWSSTTNDRQPFEAYYLNVYDGHAYPWNKAMSFSVRPVRDVAVADPVAVMATGQITGYLGAQGLARPGNGDDGDGPHGLTPDYVWSDDGRIDTPAENVLVDRHTDLMWLRDPLIVDGPPAGNVDLSQPADWPTAVDHCNALDYAGHADWRLPNINELISITQPGRPKHSVDPVAFPNAPVSPTDPESPLVWWSSTTAAVVRDGQPAGSEAWYISTGPSIIRHHVAPEFTPAKARLGYTRCVRDVAAPEVPELYRRELRSSADWNAVTVASTSQNVERVGKFILPVDPALPTAPFAAAFQDVNRFALHYDFLRAAFPDTFGALTFAEYTPLVAPRATRQYYAGSLRAFTSRDGSRAYGFDVFIDGDAAPDLLTLTETADLYQRLARTFRRRPFVYSPTQPGAVALAASWADPPFPVDYPGPGPQPDFEAYTTGDAYGTVRLMTLAELAAAQTDGRLSWQDILVLDHAPTDLDGVVAGIVTGDRQGDLSHLAVRAARRGTPNAFIHDPHEALAPYAGRLVRLTVTRAGYHVATDVTLAEAQAFWDAHRPPPVTIQKLDASFDHYDSLTQLAAGDTSRTLTARVGGKAANLARLYAFLPARYQVTGFAIPFKPYADFMAATMVTDTSGAQPVRRRLSDEVISLHADPAFQSDSAYRTARLDTLRTWIEKNGDVPDDTVSELAARIQALFGPTTMVRFRSSSNAEDGLEFNGAGLYDSTSVCAADSLDADNAGPSRCDPAQPNERSIARGLRRVWASTWNARAWDERAYWGIDQLAVGMAVLVTTAFPDERANGVAFSGNPLRPGAAEYLVNAQLGDTSVVLPEPGIVPERDILAMSGGQVTQIRRARPSSLAPPGTVVLQDDELREMGGLMADAAARFPLDLGSHRPEDVMLDFEFKLRRGDNQLLFKQVRPFLATGDATGGGTSALRVEVPEAKPLCAMWRIAHPIRQEYDEKITVDLNPGALTIPLDGGPAAADQRPAPPDLFGALRYGPRQEEAAPLGSTQADVTAPPGERQKRLVRLFRRYAVAGRTVTLTLTLPPVQAGELNVVTLDDAFLTTGAPLVAQSAPDSAVQYLAPCGLPGFDEERLDVAFEGGQAARLNLRKGAGGGFWVGYLFGEMTRAHVRLDAGERTVEDYGHLVYDALRHNWNERFWVLFDPPLGDAYGLEVRQEYLGDDRESFSAAILGADLNPLRPLKVVSARRTRPGDEPAGAVLLPWAAR